MQAWTKFLFSHCKTNWIYFSAVIVCSKPCMAPFPRMKISFFVLSTWIEELISTPKIITLLPNLPPENEKIPCLSNPSPYPEYLYLSISAF